jgi:hypothetical protein
MIVFEEWTQSSILIVKARVFHAFLLSLFFFVPIFFGNSKTVRDEHMQDQFVCTEPAKELAMKLCLLYL